MTKRNLVNSCWWWHHIDLGDGIITPGHQGDANINQQHLEWAQLPQDLTGKSVLDIGCSDGYYSFECEKRGAKVTAIDDPKINSRTENFLLAKQLLNSKVEFIPINLFDVKPNELGTFDLVLAMGLLYHLKSFYIGLEIIKQFTKELLIIQTDIVVGDDLIIRATPSASSHDHITWRPSLPLLIMVLQKIGFEIIMTNRYCEHGVVIHLRPI